MGTETLSKRVDGTATFLPVKLNNPQMGTETSVINQRTHHEIANS